MQAKRTALTAFIVGLSVAVPVSSPTAVAQDSTPTTAWSCEDVATTQAAGTPAMSGGMSGMEMGTPAAGVDHMAMEIDQMYIDMMIPHHASIIAMAQAAQDRLTDERLQAIADNIITSQQGEIEELRGYREQWYGSPDSMPMDDAMMGMMMEMMPGMGDMDAMMLQMNPDALVATFCSGEDPNFAFIDLSIPHHEMAVRASEAAVDQAAHEEIREIAERVMTDQQREIDELSAIRQELTGAATPAA